MISPDNKYTKMQKDWYAGEAAKWSPTNTNPVVGSFDKHNAHGDYELLFTDVDTKNCIGLDFGCGPGRNLVKYADRFKHLDGVDLDPTNLKHARAWCDRHGVKNNKLHLCNGIDLSCINGEAYDFVMSTICFQHICVYEIRLNYLREFFRVLKASGWLAMQMGYGVPSPSTVDYYANNYEAQGTNRHCDTSVANVDYIKNDLAEVGFDSFRHWICGPGPGDVHPNWIFFQAKK